MSNVAHKRKSTKGSISSISHQASAPAKPVVEAETLPLKEESLRWVFSIFCSIVVYGLIAKGIAGVYHPDVKALEKAAGEMFFDVGIIRPEPVEALLFKVAVLCLFPLLAGFYFIFSKTSLVRKLAADVPFSVITGACTAAILSLTWLTFKAPNPFCPASGALRMENNRDFCTNNFDFYFKGLFLENNMWAYTLIIVPLLGLLFLYGMKRKNLDESKYFNRVISFIAYPVFAYTIIAIVLMHAFSYPHTDENKFDFNSVYYSMTQVYAGVPLLVNKYMDIYGLYPHFLNPLFQIIGLNIFKFSLVMALILGAAFVLNYLFLRLFVRNRLILFLGFASVVFFPFLNFKLLTTFDCIFSLYPIRYIVPSVVGFMGALYFLKPSKARYYATFIGSAALVLWNPEIGLVCYLSWVVTVIYNAFYDSNRKIATRAIFRHAATAVVTIAAVFLAYKLLIRLFYGVWPDMGLMFATAKYYGMFGVGCLPMAVLHPWNLSAIVLLFGFIYAISAWIHRRVTVRSTAVLLISMFGVGYFVYFQGRSHDSNFALSSSFSWMLLVLLADDLWEKLKTREIIIFYPAFFICLFFLSFSFIELVAETKGTTALIYQDADRNLHQQEQNMLESEADFINKNSREGEKIFVFTVKKYQCLMFDGNKRVSAFNPGLMETFLRSDLHRMERTMIDSSFKVFAARSMRLYSYFQTLAATIAANYEVTKLSKMFAVLEKKHRPIPTGEYLTGRAENLIHRKYGNDSAGMSRRIADADSVKTVKLGSSFSAEALFFSSPQGMEAPVIIGNVADSMGFAIGKLANRDDIYFCALNNKGMMVQVPLNRWVYIVANYTPDSLEVFVNGRLMAKRPAPDKMAVSEGPVRVGAFKNYNYFIGAISEVAVSNSLRTQSEVFDTWVNIARTLPR